MPVSEIRKIVLLGAGNMATNLALALKKQGIKILQIYNRTAESGQKLSKKTGAVYINDLSRLNLKADLYIISVTDHAIKKIADNIRLGDKLIIHTSGSVDIDILRRSSENYGVLHSPQTFSKNKPVSFRNLHVDIQANSKHSEEILYDFASVFCNNVHVVNSEQRKIIHIAAVFAGNFTNFMYSVSGDILSRNDLPFNLMQPIIRKTSENSRLKDPFTRQTGPAVREDYDVIAEHLEVLSKYPQYRDIYDLISKNIIKYKKLNE